MQPGVSWSASLNISLTGMALEVPVAFMSGVAISVITPAPTGLDTLMKNSGTPLSSFTKAWVGGVAMVTAASMPALMAAWQLATSWVMSPRALK